MTKPDRPSPHATSRGRVGPAMIIAGAVTLSAAVFFGYTLPKFLNKPKAADIAEATPAPEPQKPSPQPEPAPRPTKPSVASIPTPPPLATIVPPVLLPATEATATIADLVRALRDQPTAETLAVLAPDTTASEDDLVLLQQIFREAGFQLDPDRPPRQVGEIDGHTRWQFPVVTTDKDSTTPATSQITIDMVKADDGRWRIAAINVPDALKNYIAQLPSPQSTGAPKTAATPTAPNPNKTTPTPPLDLTDPVTTSTNTHADPLSLADAFVQALAAGDFATARALADPGLLSDEKLAALFIVTEDGNFSPRPHRPVITITHDGDSALLVVRLGSPRSPETPETPGVKITQNTEFGLELAKTPEGKWRVASVNFSKLIADTAASLGAGDVAYSPVVPDPEGGDSLALYFPFDHAGVHSRASRQLGIIASILISDPNKRIKIDGHADARGPDRYNDTLSRERAINVRAALLSLGVPNDQIVMRVYGEAKPAAPNTLPDGTDNPPGRARNRRTEIFLDF